MPHVLVTGGAGYLGSTLVPELLARGHDVTVLDDFRYDERSLLPCARNRKFRAVRGDVRDERTVGELLKTADAVIPLAAIVGAPACDRTPADAVTINLDAVRLICRLRTKAQRLLFPTTNSGYGTTTGSEFCTEETAQNPVSLYGRTKVDAEAAVLEQQNAVTFRLATVFGVSPRMRLDLLVNDFTYRAVTDRSLVLYEPHFVRNYVAVRDVAALFAAAIERAESLPDGA
jgi:nucleoside-diphosphate-sugar epimerase